MKTHVFSCIKSWGSRVHISVCNCQFLPNKSGNIWLTTLKIVMLYQMNNTFDTLLFRYLSLSLLSKKLLNEMSVKFLMSWKKQKITLKFRNLTCRAVDFNLKIEPIFAYNAVFLFKGTLPGMRQFFATESSLKTMKDAFYFTLKAFRS